jgi:hypothetical protein
VRRVSVHREKDGNQQIGEIRESKAPIGECQQADKHHDEDVFQHPRWQIAGCDRRHDPDERINGE